MNELTLLREAGPEAPAFTTATRQAARAALLAEIEGPPAHRRRPARKTTLRIGVGVVAVAAAWSAAVVIAAPDDHSGPPPAGVSLVAFRPPTFPLSLDPLPAGLTPSFSEDPGHVLHAGWSSPDDRDRISLSVTPDEPDLVQPTGEQDVTVRGRDGVLATEHIPYEEGRVRVSAALVVEWHDGQWIELTGAGRFAGRQQLLAVARTLVDRPQPVPLQLHLAPAGWSLLAYKDDRILTLVDDDYDRLSLNVYLTDQPLPADRLLTELEGPPVAPVLEVSVNGRPAQLVRLEARDAADNGWYLQAQFPDGRTFVVQAPAAFTKAQVLAFADQVTYTP
jgi:hypothetical protein